MTAIGAQRYRRRTDACESRAWVRRDRPGAGGPFDGSFRSRHHLDAGQCGGRRRTLPRLEQSTRANRARVELTRNVRAQDPADRRDQQLFRHGRQEEAIRGYHARDRVVLADELAVVVSRELVRLAVVLRLGKDVLSGCRVDCGPGGQPA